MATATETSLKKWICTALNLIALIQTFLELNSKGLHQSPGKEKESCCLLFPSSTKHEIRQFYVAVMQQLQSNVQKSLMHVQSCCFNWLSKPITFLLFLLPSFCKLPNVDGINAISTWMYDREHIKLSKTKLRENKNENKNSRFWNHRLQVVPIFPQE